MAPIAGNNDKGFYEHHPIVRINMALLRRLGGSWRDLPGLPPGWQRDPDLEDLREQSRAILAADFAGARLWGFKDPRTSLLLPFWRPLIGPARFVICHRHPLEIAASLLRRDGLTLAQSLGLWRRYAGEAVRLTAGEPRIVVAYDQLFADRAGVVERLAAFVGGAERAADPLVRAEIDTWVETGLRHHVTDEDERLSHPELTDADRLLTLALDLAARGSAGALDAAARRVLDEAVAPEPAP
jgi:hypothetical protein